MDQSTNFTPINDAPQPAADAAPEKTKSTDIPSEQKDKDSEGHKALTAILILIAVNILGGVFLAFYVAKSTSDRVQNAPGLPSQMYYVDIDEECEDGDEACEKIEEGEEGEGEETEIPETQDTTSVEDANRPYFSIEEWGIKFAYPDGVTEITTNFDEGAWGKENKATQAFVVYNMTYNGELYDSVAICGWANTNQRSMIAATVYKIDPLLGEKNVYFDSAKRSRRLINTDSYSFYYDEEKGLTNLCGSNSTPADESKAKTLLELAETFVSSAQRINN